MAKYILKRILWMIPIIIGVIFLVFTLMYFTPGDPARNALGMTATEEAIEAWNAEHGLDQGFWVRLFNYYKGILHFDFGTSYTNGVSIAGEILSRFPYTILVGMLTLVIAVAVGIPTGVLAATHQNTWIDNLCMAGTMFFTAMPGFWFCLVMVMFFSLRLGWTPVSGYETWRHYIIPCVAMGVGCSAGIARQTRSSMLEVIRQDYVTTARAKGQKERNITYNHCLRNGMIPILTVIGGFLAFLISGSLVSEQIFSIPGMGVYMFKGIQQKDVPVVLGCTVVIAIYFCVIMLVTDIVYTIVDPRMKTAMISISKKVRKDGKK